MRWVDYWNTDHPIYVSDRHRTLHFQGIARDIVDLIGEVSPARAPRVLDYGCGEALGSPRIARACEHLTLSDAAPAVRERITARFAADPAISIAPPEAVAAMPPGSFDIVIANSLVQYLTATELTDLLALAHRQLAPGGTLVLADIIPPDVGAATDALALVRFGWEGGFMGAALAGLARTALSDYRKVREELGLTRYGEADMLDLLGKQGFSARRRRQNLGHNQARMTFLATPA